MKLKFSLILVFLSHFLVAQEFLQNDFVLAENYMRQNEYEKAAQIYERLFEKSPFNTSYLQQLVKCYQLTKNFEKADFLLKNQINKNKNLPYLYAFYGYNFQRQQLQEIAHQNYKEALRLIALNPNYASITARIFNDYNLLDEAIETYKIAMKVNPNTNYNFQIAQIYGEQGRYEEMFEAYIELVDKQTDYLNLTQRFTSKYITDDAENEANLIFKKSLLKRAIKNPKSEWNILLSWLFSQQKEYNKAFVQEKAIFERNPIDIIPFFTLKKIAFENQDFETAQNCVDFIKQNSSYEGELLEAWLYDVKIAIAQKSVNISEKFKTIYNQFGYNNNTLAIQIEEADFETFQNNNPKKAKLILEKAINFVSSDYDKASIELKLGDILVFTNNYNSALIYFTKIQNNLKGSELAQDARFKIAQTSYFKGDFEWAKAQLKVLKSSTTQKIANDAVDLFLKITDNEPVDSTATGLQQLAKAELLAYQNKNDEALAELELLEKNNTIFPNGFKATEPIFDDVLFFKAKILIKLKKYDEAILSLAAIVSADNQGFMADDVYYQMAELYQHHIKDVEKAKEYYQKIIFDYPTSIYLVEARKSFRKLRGDDI